MKVESPCKRAFNVCPITFLSAAQYVAGIDSSYRKINPIQEIILVHEKIEVKNFLCISSLVINNLLLGISKEDAYYCVVSVWKSVKLNDSGTTFQ